MDVESGLKESYRSRNERKIKVEDFESYKDYNTEELYYKKRGGTRK